MKKQIYLEIKKVLIQIKEVMTLKVGMYGVLEDDYTKLNSEEINDVLGQFKL